MARASGTRGATSRNDGLYPIDGGSTGAVPSFLTTAEEPGTESERPIGRGEDSVGKTAWFAPVEESPFCKDGVCTVPWLTEEKTPVVQGNAVNHPDHYNDGAIECIDAIEASLTTEEFRGFCKGNILKYLWRERHKGGTESLKKARFYLDRLIALDEAQNG